MTYPHDEALQPNGATEHVDQVLQALGNIQPTPTLNARLLANLTAQTLVPVQSTKNVWRFALPKYVALATAILFFATFVGLHHFLPGSPQSSSNSNGTKLTQSPPTATHFTGAVSSNLEISRLKPQQHSSATHSQFDHPSPVAQHDISAASPSTSQPTAVRLYLHLTGSVIPTQAALDAQALDDLHALSQPAPQPPPTRQEQLVRLMLRRGEKQDLAQLDPAARAAFSQQQSHEFQSFFNPVSATPKTEIANPVGARNAISLDEIREIDAAQQASQNSTSLPAGDLK